MANLASIGEASHVIVGMVASFIKEQHSINW